MEDLNHHPQQQQQQQQHYSNGSTNDHDHDHDHDHEHQDSKDAERQKDSKPLDFTEDEESLIARMFSLVGERWSLIAGRIPGRTAEEIEKYWTSKCSS